MSQLNYRVLHLHIYDCLECPYVRKGPQLVCTKMQSRLSADVGVPLWCPLPTNHEQNDE
jgi:hypothetical protein